MQDRATQHASARAAALATSIGNPYNIIFAHSAPIGLEAPVPRSRKSPQPRPATAPQRDRRPHVEPSALLMFTSPFARRSFQLCPIIHRQKERQYAAFWRSAWVSQSLLRPSPRPRGLAHLFAMRSAVCDAGALTCESDAPVVIMSVQYARSRPREPSLPRPLMTLALMQ
jgi:hypothetical protein